MAEKIPSQLMDALRGKISDPQLEEVAAYFFHLEGGSQGVAKLLHDEFHRANPGTLIRARIMDMVLRMLTRIYDAKGAPELGILSDEDLEKQAQRLLSNVTEQAKTNEPELGG